MAHVVSKIQDGIARVELARPDVGNAFTLEMIRELITVLRAHEADPKVRVVALSGQGKHFCLGADLGWMKDSAKQKKKQNYADALAWHDLMLTAHRLAKPLVAKVHGGAFGGGVGLAACADVVVAAADATFSLSEVRLGLVPAVIAPFVGRKIGASWLRAWGLSARRLGAIEAARLGLVHEAVPAEQLDATVGRWLADLGEGSPAAMQNFKALLWQIDNKNISMAKAKTTRAIVRARTSKEGQEGLAAFLEKRKPSWKA